MADGDPREKPLRTLAAELENALCVLEGDGSEGQGVNPAPIQRAFDELRAINDRLADRRMEPELRALFDRVRRLHTVLLATASSARETVGSELTRALQARKALAGHGAEPNTGGRCDVSG